MLCIGEKLPFGEPVFFLGEYQYDKIYNLYIQQITCSFELKKNKIPCIQIKNSYYKENEYLTSSDNEIVCLTLTNVDLKLFLEHYDVYDLQYIAGWKFKSMQGIFKEYIDKWIKIKNEATLTGNKGLRTLAKLMLNALYGKFATSLDVRSKYPVLSKEGIVTYKTTKYSTKEGVYLPMRMFYNSLRKRKNNTYKSSY